MTQSSRTLFQRIRCIKSSLDKAEQSFMDNKDIRGELDLMLAEAELKNLRRKKDRPWSWNRQVLAGCAAVLLIVAGFGGWCFAVTAACCVLGMYDKDPFTFALNVITPVVLTVLGFILPTIAKREQQK